MALKSAQAASLVVPRLEAALRGRVYSTALATMSLQYHDARGPVTWWAR